MADRIRGPYEVAYPVNFTSKGDTTTQAFGKHISEIARIYGILTGLDAATLDADAVNEILQKHIDSTNPHPKWKPSIGWSDLTSKPTLSDINGNLAANRVVGELTNATIDNSKVNGLGSFVNGVASGLLSGVKGITEASLGNEGYIKFQNGFMLQWGETTYQYEYVDIHKENEEKFGKTYTSACYGVIAQVCHNGTGTTLGAMTSVTGISTDGFKYVHEKFQGSEGGGTNPWYLRYIAIGV